MHRTTHLRQDSSSADTSLVSCWASMLAPFADCFTRPSYAIFWRLIIAWVLCPGRHTITRLYLVAEPEAARAHDAYHRFLRAGAWRLELVYQKLVVQLVESLIPEGRVELAIDDTVFQRWGPKVEGVGRYKDPVRSTGPHKAFVDGLNFVNVALLVRPPWGGMTLALPLAVRLHRKRGPSPVELGLDMLREILNWLPGRELVVVADGAYSPLARARLPRTVVVSRIRRNAEIYDHILPTRVPGQLGRPRERGLRLPSPEQMAQDPELGWRSCHLNVRGRMIERQIYSRVVLWWFTCGDSPTLLVIIRDASGRNHDDFLFTTDPTATPEWVASMYADRWAIEETHRNCKQFLGAEDPQCWRLKGPERAGAFSMVTYSLTWCWYLLNHGDHPTWPKHPWYPGKNTPSFADALAQARRELWPERGFVESDLTTLSTKLTDPALEVLAYAA